jgi:hypothetical protein
MSVRGSSQSEHFCGAVNTMGQEFRFEVDLRMRAYLVFACRVGQQLYEFTPRAGSLQIESLCPKANVAAEA